MRFLLLAALVAAPLAAQTSLRLVDPILSVDGRLTETAGAPVVQDPFDTLTISVPGQAVYTVSQRPFAGARRAGQFDGRGLYFAAQGRSVRLVSREPILSLDGPVPAYVAVAPSGVPRGRARLAVAEGVGGRGAEPTPAQPAARGPRPPDGPAARDETREGSEIRRLRSQLDRAHADRQRLAAERDRLARERDRALAARDRALAARDAAYAQRDAATVALGAAQSSSDSLRAEHDALRVEVAGLRDRPAQPAGRPGLDAEWAALRRDRALLDADRAALAAERDAFETARTREPGDAWTLAERQSLLDRIADAQAQREALAAERDALADDCDRLTRQLGEARARTAAAAKATAPEPVTIRTQPADQGGAVAFLPGFDFARLQNPDVVRRRLDEASYPRWAAVGRIEGDVLVLFQTDRTGRVVRTAVPAPIGGGLDGLAEGIVREMRFRPTTAGEALRSQLIVRFEL